MLRVSDAHARAPTRKNDIAEIECCGGGGTGGGTVISQRGASEGSVVGTVSTAEAAPGLECSRHEISELGEHSKNKLPAFQADGSRCRVTSFHSKLRHALDSDVKIYLYI